MEEERSKSCERKEQQVRLIFDLRRTNKNEFEQIREIIQDLERRPNVKVEDLKAGGFSDRAVKLTGKSVVLTVIIEEIKANLGERVFVEERLPASGTGRIVVLC